MKIRIMIRNNNNNGNNNILIVIVVKIIIMRNKGGKMKIIIKIKDERKTEGRTIITMIR